MNPATKLPPTRLGPIKTAFSNEADGIRTRNHRIDSPELYPIELRPLVVFLGTDRRDITTPAAPRLVKLRAPIHRS